jgi:hypothetical protein
VACSVSVSALGTVEPWSPLRGQPASTPIDSSIPSADHLVESIPGIREGYHY